MGTRRTHVVSSPIRSGRGNPGLREYINPLLVGTKIDNSIKNDREVTNSSNGDNTTTATAESTRIDAETLVLTSSQEDRLLTASPTMMETSKDMDSDDQVTQVLDKLNLKGKSRGPKLNGAAKKRFAWLMKKGVKREEALVKCRIPINTREETAQKRENPKTNQQAEPNTSKASRGNKRNRSNTSISPQETTKRVKANPEQTQPRNSSSPSFSSVVKPCIKIGIAPKTYPEAKLDEKGAEDIRKDILKQIFEQRDGTVKPKFTRGSSNKSGWMILYCADETTAQWIKNLKIWPIKELKAMEEKDFPTEHVLMGYFSNSTEDSSEFILGVLKGVNDNLKTEDWRVLNRKEDRKTKLVSLLLEVDAESVKVIASANFQLDYGMGQRVKFRAINRADGPTKRPADTAGKTPRADGPSVCKKPPKAPTMKVQPKGVTKGTKPKAQLQSKGQVQSGNIKPKLQSPEKRQ